MDPTGMEEPEEPGHKGGRQEGSKQRRAFDDYYSLGPGRSISKLLALYEEMQRAYNRGEAGAELPPTRRENTLKEWSSWFGWVERCRVREAQIAEKTERELEGSRLTWKLERLEEAQTARRVGSHFMRHVAERLAGMNLNEIPLLDQVKELGGNITQKDDGSTIRTGTKPIIIPGLLSYLPTAARLIELGHKHERQELGEIVPTSAGVVDEILSGLDQLPDEVQEAFRAELLAVMGAGEEA